MFLTKIDSRPAFGWRRIAPKFDFFLPQFFTNRNFWEFFHKLQIFSKNKIRKKSRILAQCDASRRLADCLFLSETKFGFFFKWILYSKFAHFLTIFLSRFWSYFLYYFYSLFNTFWVPKLEPKSCQKGVNFDYKIRLFLPQFFTKRNFWEFFHIWCYKAGAKMFTLLAGFFEEWFINYH